MSTASLLAEEVIEVPKGAGHGCLRAPAIQTVVVFDQLAEISQGYLVS